MASDSQPRFGGLLRFYRRREGLTQEELAQRAGLSARGISDLERGANRSPQPGTALALADALDLSPTEREHFLAARRRVTPLAASGARKQSLTPSAAPGALSLIGRDHERARIERLLAGDEASMLLFYGEPGIGKSRLLQDAAERAQQAGWTVLRGGSGQSDGQHPYSPLVQALQGSLAGLSRAQRRQRLEGCSRITHLLPELVDDALPSEEPWRLAPEQERRFMFADVLRYIARIAHPVGVLLALDDLQWAAPDGLSLLAWLLHSAAVARSIQLRVVAASRDIPPGADHPLRDLIVDLTRGALVSVARLGPLEAGQAGALSRAALDGLEGLSPDERETLTERVVARAGGVPLFIMSFARAMRASVAERSQLPQATDVPWDIAEMIRQRIEGLPAVARDVLLVAAIYGRETPLSLLVSAAGAPERQVVEAVEAACAAGLLKETGGATCAFTHDLYREVTRASLSAVRARMIHRHIAEALEADPLRAQASPLAFHYGHSADTERAILYLEGAGDQARALHAYTAAEARYRDALGRLGSVGDSGASGRVWEKLGSLLMGCGKYEGAIGALDEAVSAYRAAGDRDGIGRAIAQIGWAYVRGGSGSQGLRRVEALLTPDELTSLAPPTRAALLCAHAVLLFALNRYDEQLASAREASALARAASDTEAMARSLRQEGLALVQLGRFDEALPITLETIQLAELAGDLDSYSAALNDTAAVYRIRGELRSSWDYSARSVEVAERLGDPTAIAFFAGSHGDNAYLLGDWAAARHSFERSVAVARDMGSSWVTAYALYSLGQLDLVQGRDEEAIRYLDEAVTCAERDHDLQALRCVQAVLAERDLVRGAASDALQRLQPLLDPATADEKDSVALLPFVAWAWLSLGDLAGAAKSLSECMRRAEAAGNRLVALDGLLAQARLFIRGAEWSRAEKALDDALASAGAMAYPYAQAKARFIYGQLRAATGARAQARSQYERALGLCDRLGEKLYRAQIERALTQLAEA